MVELGIGLRTRCGLWLSEFRVMVPMRMDGSAPQSHPQRLAGSGSRHAGQCAERGHRPSRACASVRRSPALGTLYSVVAGAEGAGRSSWE